MSDNNSIFEPAIDKKVENFAPPRFTSSKEEFGRLL